MSAFEQKTIEHFFQKYEIVDPDMKARLLPLVTDIIYDYNMHVVRLEKETDEYKKHQFITGLEEIEAKLNKIFTTELGR
ncbi:MAG: hypothetical protein V1848_01190 [Candidatus Magasanikbacteria bacterium]